MAKFKKGDAVRQIIKPIEGVVESFTVDQESGDVQIKVAVSDGTPDGTHAYHFKEDQLELNPAQTA